MVLRKSLLLLALMRAAAIIITIYRISPYCFIWIQVFPPCILGIGPLLIPLLTLEVVLKTSGVLFPAPCHCQLDALVTLRNSLKSSVQKAEATC